MASLSTEGGRPPGRTALAGRTQAKHETPGGGKPGLTISEEAHLGKINLRGDAGLLPAVRKHTGCTAFPDNNRMVTVGDRHAVILLPSK